MDVLGYLKFLAALIFVLALIAGLAYGVRRYGLGGIVTTPGRTRRRLAVVETLAIDPRHRLILVRRDTVEYLLVIGNANLFLERIDPEASPQADPPHTDAPKEDPARPGSLR